MTKLLDILEDFCAIRQYKYSRIDGSMKLEDRQAQVRVKLFTLSILLQFLCGIFITCYVSEMLKDKDIRPSAILSIQNIHGVTSREELSSSRII